MDVYHALKNEGKMRKCWILELCQVGICEEQALVVVVAAQPRACPSPGVSGVGWELWDGGQAPPGLMAAPEVQHSWLFLWLSLCPTRISAAGTQCLHCESLDFSFTGI